MKLVKPSTTILSCYPENIMKTIEQVARTCYKSEDKIKDGSDVLMFNKLVKNKHDAMLEFGYHPIFQISTVDYIELINLQSPKLETDEEYYVNSFMEFTNIERPLVSASIRIYRDLIINHSNQLSIKKLANTLWLCYDHILINDIYDPNWLHHGTYENILPKDLTTTEGLYHIYPIVKFICDRGVSHELVRHRLCSFAQESTRYCNYKDQEIEFIIPCWFTSDDVITCTNLYLQKYTNCNEWYFVCLNAEESYKNMLVDGWSPQQARTVLPNSLKTEINVQCNLKEWKHIFKLRCANGAHPQMRELMVPLLEEFQSHYTQFENLQYDN